MIINESIRVSILQHVIAIPMDQLVKYVIVLLEPAGVEEE